MSVQNPLLSRCAEGLDRRSAKTLDEIQMPLGEDGEEIQRSYTPLSNAEDYKKVGVLLSQRALHEHASCLLSIFIDDVLWLFPK